MSTPTTQAEEGDTTTPAPAPAPAPAPPQQQQRPATTFYRRPLPANLIAFSSVEGRRLFREALESGGMEGFFSICEVFQHQSDPAFCGLGSLSMALNALGIDPGRAWKGPWRWFDESLLDCCEPLPVVQQQGIPLRKLHCLARCNGAQSRMTYGDAVSLDAFREDVIRVTHAPPSDSGPEVLVAGYSRKKLGQTGDGHFSPVGGYHRGKDLVLLMDVARFKYPPHWVPLPRLWEALQPLDPATGRPRGYLLLTRPSAASTGPSLLLSLDKGRYADWPALRDWLLQLHLQQAHRGFISATTTTPANDEEAEDEAAAFRRFLASLPPALASLVTPLPGAGAVLAAAAAGAIAGGGNGDAVSPRAALRRLVAAIEAHPLFPLLTPEVLAPFLRSRSRSMCGDDEAAGTAGTGGSDHRSACCCSEFTRVRDGGHALLLLFLALREWAAGSGAGAEAGGSSGGRLEEEDEGRRLLRHEVAQLHVKLQALAAEMVGSLPAQGLGQHGE